MADINANECKTWVLVLLVSWDLVAVTMSSRRLQTVRKDCKSIMQRLAMYELERVDINGRRRRFWSWITDELFGWFSRYSTQEQSGSLELFGCLSKGALYPSLLLTSLHLGHLNNETLSITQGNSQSIVTTYKGIKLFLSGPLNYGIFIKHSVCRKKWLKSREFYHINSAATFNLSVITIARSGDVHPMPGPDSGSTMAITTSITNRSRRKYQSHYYPPSSRNNLITIQCSNRLTADRCKQQD